MKKILHKFLFFISVIAFSIILYIFLLDGNT